MTDADSPKRGSGRPKADSAKAPRRNVTVQVDAAVYDAMSSGAADQGLSISKFVESAIKDKVDGSVITSNAAYEAVERYEEELIASFNGRLGFSVGVTAAGLFAESLRKALEKRSSELGARDIPRNELEALSDATVREAFEKNFSQDHDIVFKELWTLIDGLNAALKIQKMFRTFSEEDKKSVASSVSSFLAPMLKTGLKDDDPGKGD